MQGYSYIFNEKEAENFAFARAEGVEASYKDLTQVCGRVRGRTVAWALVFLQKACEGDIPIMFKKFNKNLAHRRELGGKKGRYPKKAAVAVLKAVKSVAANARIKGLSDDLTIVHILANKKDSVPRLQSKGRRSRSDYETARIEIVVKGKLSIEKKIGVKAPEKKIEHKPEEKKVEQKPVEPKNEVKIEEKKSEPAVETKAGEKKEAKEQAKKVDLSILKKGAKK